MSPSPRVRDRIVRALGLLALVVGHATLGPAPASAADFLVDGCRHADGTPAPMTASTSNYELFGGWVGGDDGTFANDCPNGGSYSVGGYGSLLSYKLARSSTPVVRLHVVGTVTVADWPAGASGSMT